MGTGGQRGRMQCVRLQRVPASQCWSSTCLARPFRTSLGAVGGARAFCRPAGTGVIAAGGVMQSSRLLEYATS
jgi:hypothetical protein